MNGDEKANVGPYPPQQPTYPDLQKPPPYPEQQPPPMAQQLHVQMAPMVMAPKLGKESEAVSCLNCRAEVRTTVKRELSQSGWIWSFVLWYGN